jgi:hypothetical protein
LDIRDKHPASAKLDTSSPNLLGLKEPNINQTLCGKGILGETKSFLQSKAPSVALKRGKTPVNWMFFNLQQDTAAVSELCPQGQSRNCSLPS